MSGYFIYELDIFDPAGFQRYADEARDMMRSFGGKLMLSSDKVVPMEGGWAPPLVVMAKFDTVEAAERFYNSHEYASMLALRNQSARSKGILVESHVEDNATRSVVQTAAPPTDSEFSFDFTRGASGFQPKADTALEEKTLGLGLASGGVVDAKLIRACGSPAGIPPIEFQNDFHSVIYVVRGHAGMTNSVSGNRLIRKGSAVYLSPKSKWLLGEWSFDMEILVINVRARGVEQPLSTDIDDESPDSFVQGPPGREYLALRPLHLADRTDRQIEATVIRGKNAPAGGTGWHRHSNSEWVFILSGAAELGMKGSPKLTIRAGDSLTFPPGSIHEVPTFSEDYSLIAINTPADFKTYAEQSPNQDTKDPRA